MSDENPKQYTTEEIAKLEKTRTPEQGIDFETARAFVPDLSALYDEPISKVIEYVKKTYGDRYYIPGDEYMKWLQINPDKNPPGTDIKNRSLYSYLIFPGSKLNGYSGPNGRWFVEPHMFRTESGQWSQNIGSSYTLWNRDIHVVLLEK